MFALDAVEDREDSPSANHTDLRRSVDGLKAGELIEIVGWNLQFIIPLSGNWTRFIKCVRTHMAIGLPDIL